MSWALRLNRAQCAPAGKAVTWLFQKLHKECWSALPAPDATPPLLEFIGVPAGPGMPSPYDALLGLIGGATKEIRIAAHKITAPPTSNFKLVDALVARLAAGVPVRIVFDDDAVLKALGLPDAEALNVSSDDLAGYERLRAAGAEVVFIDTNEGPGLLMHNKYVVVDGQAVFTGAGNFSAASLTGKNTEQLYVARNPALVAAYMKAWDELRGWAQPREAFAPAPPYVLGPGRSWRRPCA